MQMHLLLSSGRSSYFRMVFCSFHFLPIFLLAQILMRADLGDEPEHPLEVVISNPPGQDATRTPQLTGNVGQRSLHSARISEETRTADTATLCQTPKVSLTETRTRVLANGGQAPNQLHHRGSRVAEIQSPSPSVSSSRRRVDETRLPSWSARPPKVFHRGLPCCKELIPA